jgi:hypothetical protein
MPYIYVIIYIIGFSIIVFFWGFFVYCPLLYMYIVETSVLMKTSSLPNMVSELEIMVSARWPS